MTISATMMIRPMISPAPKPFDFFFFFFLLLRALSTVEVSMPAWATVDEVPAWGAEPGF